MKKLTKHTIYFMANTCMFLIAMFLCMFSILSYRAYTAVKHDYKDLEQKYSELKELSELDYQKGLKAVENLKADLDDNNKTIIDLNKKLDSANETIEDLESKKKELEQYIKELKECTTESTTEEVTTEATEVTTEEMKEEITSAETTRTYLGNYTLTAYIWTGNPCADGVYPSENYTVACNDPNLWHKWIYIEGLGDFYVHDTGGMSSYNIIDVYVGTYDAAVNFGCRSADVYVY